MNQRLQGWRIITFHNKIFFNFVINFSTFHYVLFNVPSFTFNYFIFYGEIEFQPISGTVKVFAVKMLAAKRSTANMLMAKIPDMSTGTGTQPPRERILALSLNCVTMACYWTSPCLNFSMCKMSMAIRIAPLCGLLRGLNVGSGA